MFIDDAQPSGDDAQPSGDDAQPSGDDAQPNGDDALTSIETTLTTHALAAPSTETAGTASRPHERGCGLYAPYT